MNFQISKISLMVLILLFSGDVLASDSYRYMHVSIDTPWAIFVFLLFIILFPFVLSAILYWHFTFKKNKQDTEQQENQKSAIEENNG